MEDYGSIKNEVAKNNKLKTKKTRKKINSQLTDFEEKYWLITNVKKVLMNL